jgi:hypothetical protein
MAKAKAMKSKRKMAAAISSGDIMAKINNEKWRHERREEMKAAKSGESGSGEASKAKASAWRNENQYQWRRNV